MRILIGCVLLFIGPPLLVVGYKHYQAMQLEKSRAQQLTVTSNHGEVLFFNATWCGPCRQMKPIVTQLRRQGYHLRDIDVDRHKALAQKYNVRGVPTFVFIENGQEVNRFSGGTSRENLIKLCSGPMYH